MIRNSFGRHSMSSSNGKIEKKKLKFLETANAYVYERSGTSGTSSIPTQRKESKHGRDNMKIVCDNIPF